MSDERIFVIGGTGDIGSGVVRGLISKCVYTTIYVRDENKSKKLFENEIKSGYLNIVIGDYSTVEIFRKSIENHSRLFLLILANSTDPKSMSQIKEEYARIAYEKGVQQIVDLSSFTVGAFGREGIIGYIHTTAEEKLWALVDEKGHQRSLVVLRPTAFMSNHFMGDVQTIKKLNKIVSVGSPSAITTWIDTKDISECAVIILTEPISKHDRCVYQMGGETLTNEERAKVFSRILNREIIYEQESFEKIYKTLIEYGMTHSFVYDILSLSVDQRVNCETPQLSLILHRPLNKLEDWIKEHRNSFE